MGEHTDACWSQAGKIISIYYIIVQSKSALQAQTLLKYDSEL